MYRIRKKNSRAKPHTVHFNRLKPYLQPVMSDSRDGQIRSEGEQGKPEPRKEETITENDEYVYTISGQPDTTGQLPGEVEATPTHSQELPVPTDYPPDIPLLRHSTRIQ